MFHQQAQQVSEEAWKALGHIEKQQYQLWDQQMVHSNKLVAHLQNQLQLHI
jgi:hypothetical protein